MCIECVSVTVTISITITTIIFLVIAARPRWLNAAQATVSIQEWIDAERSDNDDDEATGIFTSESDSSEFDAGEEVDNVELNNDTSSSAEDETTHDEEPEECFKRQDVDMD